MNDEEPLGTLTVFARLQLPDLSAGVDEGLANVDTHEVAVLTTSCSRHDANDIVSKIRSENPLHDFRATWTGENEL